jgi:hypothetical protein
MALHLRAEFAKICGLSTGNLSNYIKRGKVILSGDYIDDSIPQNKEFLEKRGVKASPQSSSATTKKPRVDRPQITPLEVEGLGDPDIPEDDEDDSGGESLHLLSKKRQKVEIRKKNRETVLLELKIKKQRGEVIPTELVKDAFGQFSRRMAIEFKNSVDQILTELTKKKDFNLNEIAELRGLMLSSINLSVESGVHIAKKDIDNIVNQHIEKRGIGERT